MSAAHPIDDAWISTGGTGAQNYDEFADEAEITDVVAANPLSALAIEMPHLATPSTGQTFRQSLPLARARLQAAHDGGAYERHTGAVAVYRITSPDGTKSLGLFAMVDTSEISTHRDEPGRVIRNEDVFAAKVRERVALIEAIDHLLSAVLLIQTHDTHALEEALQGVCAQSGEPSVRDVDAADRAHEVWVVTDPGQAASLCELAGTGELIVADGNHRSLAAQQAGLDRFLAVITTERSLSLDPYHRLISHWPPELGPVDAALRSAGLLVEPLPGPVRTPTERGVVHLYAGGQGYAVSWGGDIDPTAGAVEAMDHALLERIVIRGVLGWDPSDSRITYVGGDYPASWLVSSVDQGRADVAILVAPVTVEDFVAVNVDRSAMPRKSTWFTPKARAGLVTSALG
ncbi:MAG: DUF1015 family protein [Ornithinimicrobium sp.]